MARPLSAAPPKKRPPNGAVKVTKVSERILATAKSLAGEDGKVVILAPNKVEVTIP